MGSVGFVLPGMTVSPSRPGLGHAAKSGGVDLGVDPYQRDLLITVDGAGATLDLINHITALNTVHGRRVHYSVGFDLDHRARAAISELRETDWQHVWDRDGNPRDLDGDHAAGVVELTGLLRTSHGGDELATGPRTGRQSHTEAGGLQPHLG